MDKTADIFMNYKKHVDYKLALKLQYQGVIITPSDLFEQSNQTKIEFLLANGVLLPLQYNFNKYTGVCLFKSCLECETKRKTTNKPYKKSCFVVQGYNKIEKMVLLTQIPTI